MREYPDLRLPPPVTLPGPNEWPLEIRAYLSRLVIEHTKQVQGGWAGVAKWALAGTVIDTLDGKRTVPFRAMPEHLYPYLEKLARGEVPAEWRGSA